MVAAHGSDVGEVLEAADGPESLAPFAPDVPLSAAEVRHAIRREMACTLADVLERRSRVALFATEATRAIAPRVAAIIAAELAWSAERRDTELAAFVRQCDARLAWRTPASMSPSERAARSYA